MTTTPATTTPGRATVTPLRPARPCLEMRWAVRETPGSRPALVARWATTEVVAPRPRAAA